MSEFDEMDFDEEDYEEYLDPDELTPEEAFSMVTINKIKKKKVSVVLKDSEGDEIELADIITELLAYMKDKMESGDNNQFNDQIMPLISQSVVGCLGRMLGIRGTAFMLAQDSTKNALIGSMSMAFLLLKYVQKHKLKIYTIEEDVTDEEIEDIERKSEANRIAMIGAMAGADPQAVLKELRDSGKITDADLRDMLGEDDDDNEDL